MNLKKEILRSDSEIFLGWVSHCGHADCLLLHGISCSLLVEPLLQVPSTARWLQLAEIGLDIPMYCIDLSRNRVGSSHTRRSGGWAALIDCGQGTPWRPYLWMEENAFGGLHSSPFTLISSYPRLYGKVILCSSGIFKSFLNQIFKNCSLTFCLRGCFACFFWLSRDAVPSCQLQLRNSCSWEVPRAPELCAWRCQHSVCQQLHLV